MRHPIALALCACILISGCARRALLTVGPDQVSGDQLADPAVTWQSNRELLRAVLQGSRYDQHQLGAAIGFFEGVTGIPSGLPATALGYVLDRDKLSHALIQWDAWYVEHGRQLRQDPVQESRVPGRSS